ncbi:MAG: four helix bundle protein [Candidatus Parcubacteria bacterium]|nr:four helix bundle protein [Candidatus Parcubacteria bacterium]
MAEYLKLETLEIYRLGRQASKIAWQVYGNLKMDEKIIIGQQFVKSTDSIAANIAEGYGRYHFLEKVKFYYNARASLLETIHWVDVLEERVLIKQNEATDIRKILDDLHIKLNSYIKYTLDKKSSNPKLTKNQIT